MNTCNNNLKNITFCLIFLVFSCSAESVAQNKREMNLKPGQISLSLIQNSDFLNSVLNTSQREKDTVLAASSKILRDQMHSVTDKKHKDYVPDDFKNVIPIIDFMLAIDSLNGHAIYFKGEVYRLLNVEDRFLEFFKLYIKIEDSIGTQLKDLTNPRLCYDTARGYCEHRTAWIYQLLANYYYKKGTTETDLKRRNDLLNAARIYIQKVRTHFPNGFNSSSVTLSTLELENNIH